MWNRVGGKKRRELYVVVEGDGFEDRAAPIHSAATTGGVLGRIEANVNDAPQDKRGSKISSNIRGCVNNMDVDVLAKGGGRHRTGHLHRMFKPVNISFAPARQAASIPTHDVENTPPIIDDNHRALSSTADDINMINLSFGTASDPNISGISLNTTLSLHEVDSNFKIVSEEFQPDAMDALDWQMENPLHLAAAGAARPKHRESYKEAQIQVQTSTSEKLHEMKGDILESMCTTSPGSPGSWVGVCDSSVDASQDLLEMSYITCKEGNVDSINTPTHVHNDLQICRSPEPTLSDFTMRNVHTLFSRIRHNRMGAVREMLEVVGSGDFRDTSAIADENGNTMLHVCAQNNRR
jgi:hypothetical protein